MGITRRMDELNRIVLPKEFTKELGLKEGASFDITMNERDRGDGRIVRGLLLELFEDLNGPTWTLTSSIMPEQMETVLFVTKKGKIHKGFLNLRDAWVIENDPGLPTLYIEDNADVIGWMELPDNGWIKMADEAPEDDSYVLSKDPVFGDIHIIRVAGNWWVIKNHPDDEQKFMDNPDDESLWMPLPEIPDICKQ